MKKMPKSLAEALEKDLPEFCKAVDVASHDGIDMMLTLNAFENEPILFYTAMWYAKQKGVQVILGPDKEANGQP